MVVLVKVKKGGSGDKETQKSYKSSLYNYYFQFKLRKKERKIHNSKVLTSKINSQQKLFSFSLHFVFSSEWILFS